MLIGFLPNKESIRGARANPMHFYSLRELARGTQASQAETSVHYTSGNFFLYGDVLPRSCNAIEGANKTWLVKVRPTAMEAEGAKPAQRNLTAGQHDG